MPYLALTTSRWRAGRFLNPKGQRRGKRGRDIGEPERWEEGDGGYRDGLGGVWMHSSERHGLGPDAGPTLGGLSPYGLSNSGRVIFLGNVGQSWSVEGNGGPPTSDGVTSGVEKGTPSLFTQEEELARGLGSFPDEKVCAAADGPSGMPRHFVGLFSRTQSNTPSSEHGIQGSSLSHKRRYSVAEGGRRLTRLFSPVGHMGY